MKRNRKVFNIVLTAIMISLSIVFDIVLKALPLLKMPYGGSLTLSMLPLVCAAVMAGPLYALVGSVIYGLINCFLLDGYAFNLASFILDYMIAYMGVSIVGLFRNKILDNKKIYFVIGFIIAILIRITASGFSGVINAKVWGYDEEFLEGIFGKGKNSKIYLYIYSFILYNLPYIGISGIVQIILGLSIYKVLFLNDTFIIKN